MKIPKIYLKLSFFPLQLGFASDLVFDCPLKLSNSNIDTAFLYDYTNYYNVENFLNISLNFAT